MLAGSVKIFFHRKGKAFTVIAVSQSKADGKIKLAVDFLRLTNIFAERAYPIFFTHLLTALVIPFGRPAGYALKILIPIPKVWWHNTQRTQVHISLPAMMDLIVDKV